MPGRFWHESESFGSGLGHDEHLKPSWDHKVNQLRHLLDLWTCWSLEEQTAFVQKVELEIVGVGLVEERFLWVGFQHLCWWITKFWDIYTKNTSWLQISWHFSIRISCINRGKNTRSWNASAAPWIITVAFRRQGTGRFRIGKFQNPISNFKTRRWFQRFFQIFIPIPAKWSNFTNIFQMGCKKNN